MGTSEGMGDQKPELCFVIMNFNPQSKERMRKFDTYLSNKHDQLLAELLQPDTFKKKSSLAIVDGFSVLMTEQQIAVISLLFLFSDAARFPNTVDDNMVVSRDALDTSAVALLQPPEKQEAGTEPNETAALVLRPVGNKENETESSLPSGKKEKEKETSVSLPEHSFEDLRLFRPCHPRRHRHRFRGVDVVPLTFGDDVTSSRNLGEEVGDSTEEAVKHTVTVTSTREVAVHEEMVNRDAVEGDQDATKESRAQKVKEVKTTPTKIILPESNKDREDGGRKKKEPKKKKDQQDSDSDSDSDDEMEMEMEKEMKKRKRKKEKKGGWWKWFWGLWD
ncbi:hypothetical protein ZIOFF_059996 [Zingiber officinale]|uniref:Uncharacterized protein n=1 Tax=Zingiber officinale TaxID=94328 RepID=A0A8J5FA66_ZINOF|nr:hypothetical protein ZIOFF_059996 [Zingiber officinale]